MAVVARSEEMQLVAYALSRCGAASPNGGATCPPEWLGVDRWRDAYALFFDRLGDGRTSTTFANSLKNARDAFDAHVPSGRVGWVDVSGAAQRQDVMVGRILAKWGSKSDDELKEVVLDILDSEGHLKEESTATTEGGQKMYMARKYERSAKAKKDAISIHGTICAGCEFDFGKVYGQHGEGFIEVHHAIPLADHGVRETDPKTDLIVLCANCHRMVHRKRGVCLSLDELRNKLIAANTPIT
jgi:predicted HNH restriction endonuclease